MHVRHSAIPPAPCFDSECANCKIFKSSLQATLDYHCLPVASLYRRLQAPIGSRGL